MGIYVRRWCPELSKLPDDMVHEPFSASEVVLATAGIQLGKSYPYPVVDHRMAREAALAGYSKVRATAV